MAILNECSLFLFVRKFASNVGCIFFPLTKLINGALIDNNVFFFFYHIFLKFLLLTQMLLYSVTTCHSYNYEIFVSLIVTIYIDLKKKNIKYF